MADRRKKASDFAQRWRGRRGSETSETREFWEDLLENVLDVSKPYQFIQTEKKVKIDDHNRRIDVYIPKTKVLIEQKDKSISLDHKGPLGTAYEQARLYESELPLPEKPKWIITCNFKEFRIYDRVHPNLNPIIFALEELPDNIETLEILANEEIRKIVKEERASIEAAEIISKLYNNILKEYKKPTEEELDSLNIFCVRLAFCMYLEDAGIFNRGSFQNLIEDYMARPWDLRDELFRLFNVLDTPVEDRDKYLPDNLKYFPYVDGELFAQRNLIIPQFTETIVKNIYEACNFGWEEISPAIFGAAYESTINPETRRKYGMHYTSRENIHKVIDPLFLDDLKAEVDLALNKTIEGGTRTKAINNLRDKLANLQFLDPACGSGNFLTEAFIELRRLENILIAEQVKRETKISKGVQITAGFEENIDQLIRVKLDNFHGIEIQPFAVAVARTSLWIAEIKMKKETNELINTEGIRILPLSSKPSIHHKNALRIDWNSIVSSKECNYIMGNPPYLGYSFQNDDQKQEIRSIFVNEKGKPYPKAGKIDYISGWFFKAAEYIQDSGIKVAFVSTSSVTQGDQVKSIWEPISKRFNIFIDFAVTPFKWKNTASKNAEVYCVIIGFSQGKKDHAILFNEESRKIVNHINFYLKNAPDVFIGTRKKNISGALHMRTGNRPADGGNLIIENKDYKAFIKAQPEAKPYIKRLMGSEEFINDLPRYCLWLVDLTPSEIRKMPLVKKRVEACRKDRLKGSDDRKKLAKTPTLFRETLNPKKAVVVPKYSSKTRKYVPIGLVGDDVIFTDLVFIIPDGDLYEFGVVTSNISNIWFKEVCGRMGDEYRYSNEIVYNNFPWPEPSENQKALIKKTAQSILDTRDNYPKDNLADLYDKTVMPFDLRKAHEANDRAVMDAYGFSYDMSEEEIVAELMKLYKKLIDQK